MRKDLQTIILRLLALVLLFAILRDDAKEQCTGEHSR